MAEESVAPFVLGQGNVLEGGVLEVSWMLSKVMADRYVLTKCDIDELGQSFVMRFEPVHRVPE